MTALRLIDTSVWIRVLDGHADPVATARVSGYLERHEAVSCAPIVFEVLRGVKEPARFDQLRDDFESLQRFPIDWIEAARWASTTAIRALKVKSMDLLIAHTAMVNSATLVHADADFDRLARNTDLAVESLVAKRHE